MGDARRPRDDRLRLARLARGYSQDALARAATVTRQAISGIESGRWQPSLDVAFALARALDTTVDDLFGQPDETPLVDVRLALTPHRAAPVGRRVLLAEVLGDTVAFPLAEDGAFQPGFAPALGVLEAPDASPRGGASGRAGRRRPAVGAKVRPLAEPGSTLVVAGCDPALALLQGPLGRHRHPTQLVWRPCGNDAALAMLESGSVHVAAVHRAAGVPLRPRTGTEVVGFAAWREGLATSPRAASGVKDVGDAAALGLRVANREAGSEARRLLDEHLVRACINPSDLVGYETACTAHLLVASAIAAGLADVGVTTEPAALAFELGFVPWQDEVSELHIPRAAMESLAVRALLDVLGGRELASQLGLLEGYDTEPCGRIMSHGS